MPELFQNVLIVLGSVAVMLAGAIWAIKGVFNDAQKRKDDAENIAAESKKQMRKADRMLDDPAYKQRLFDEDNS